MIAFLDTSVYLRQLLNQSDALKEFSSIQRPVASRLLRVEALRTLDRLRIQGLFSEAEFVKLNEELRESMIGVEWVEMSAAVLERAGASFAISIGTLDAIHLASALLWREQSGMDARFLTHDEALGRAAKTLGFSVLGCKPN